MYICQRSHVAQSISSLQKEYTGDEREAEGVQETGYSKNIGAGAIQKPSPPKGLFSVLFSTMRETRVLLNTPKSKKNELNRKRCSRASKRL